MPHDDSKPCARIFGPMGKHHMMAPLFVHLNKTLPWSPCSAMYLTELLDGGHGRHPSSFSLASCWRLGAARPASSDHCGHLCCLWLSSITMHHHHLGSEEISEMCPSPNLPCHGFLPFPQSMLFLAPSSSSLRSGLI